MTDKLTDEQIVELVEIEFKDAIGAPGGDISIERGRAWEYYNRQLFGHEEDDISKVVTSDVMEVVDGNMPALMRMFTSQDNLLTFDAVGAEDEAGAEQESDYISHIFFKRNPAFEIIFFWTFDALLQKNGYVKAYWDDSEDVTSESYEGLSELELLDLMSDPELEPVERSERQGETVDNDGNQIQGIVHDVKFRRVVKTGRIVVENVPPEEFRISADAKHLDPSKARMVAHERLVKRGELLEMGFPEKLVADLPAESESTEAEDASARKDKTDDHNLEGGKGIDKSQDEILLREAFIRCDQDGDGRAELKQVFIADGKALEINDSDRQPFHAISSAPLPHKHMGMATAEKVMDNQLITSTLLRQILTNLYHTNNPGHGVWDQAVGDGTLTELLTRKVGTVTQFKRPVSESYQAMTVPFTAAESFPMLEYFDKVKRDRTGISSDAEGLSPAELKHVQQSVMSSSQSISKGKLELIARIFAETGFKTLFLHLHELTMKHQKDADVVKLRNEWVQVNPQEWRNRRDMTVQIGLGIGTREQNLLHLQNILDLQTKMVEGGALNLLVTPKNLYNSASEVVKNANLKRPDMFFTDPGDKLAPPPSSQQEELKKRELALQERQQKLDTERQQVNAAKLQLDAQQQRLDDRLEFEKLNEKREEREDKMSAENEKLRNQLLKIREDAADKDADRRLKARQVADSGRLTDAQIEEAKARTEKIKKEAKVVDSDKGSASNNDNGKGKSE